MSAEPLVPETSPGFITTEEAHKAAYDNGFRVELGRQGGWTGYPLTLYGHHEAIVDNMVDWSDAATSRWFMSDQFSSCHSIVRPGPGKYPNRGYSLFSKEAGRFL